MKDKLINLLASRVSIINHQASLLDNVKRAESEIESLIREFMPSGSGFNNGTSFDFDSSNKEKLVFYTGFHHMNEFGYYTGWTMHKVVATPSFRGFNLRVTGKDKNDIKEYIRQVFHNALSREIELIWNRIQLSKK